MRTVHTNPLPPLQPAGKLLLVLDGWAESHVGSCRATGQFPISGVTGQGLWASTVICLHASLISRIFLHVQDPSFTHSLCHLLSRPFYSFWDQLLSQTLFTSPKAFVFLTILVCIRKNNVWSSSSSVILSHVSLLIGGFITYHFFSFQMIEKFAVYTGYS